MPCSKPENTRHRCYESLDDRELVARAQDGDQRAFAALFQRYERPLFSRAYGIVRNESDAHDVLQDAQVAIFTKLGTLRDDAVYFSWAYRVVTNYALMHLRRNKRRAETDFDGVLETAIPQTQAAWNRRPDQQLDNRELAEQLAIAVEALEPKYRRAFLLREVDDLSMKELGRRLNLSVPAVKSRLHRARDAMRVSLTRYAA